MVGIQPGQELPGPGRLLGPAGRAHRVLQQLDGLLGASDHLLPVLDGFLDQPEDFEQAVLQVGDQRVGAVRPRGRQDLQVHPGLGGHGGVVGRLGGADDPAQLAIQVATDQELRVEHLANAPILAKQLHGHRVHEERPVIGDDLHRGGAARRPPVISLARRTDRDHRTGCGPVQGGPVVAGHQAQQILDPTLVHVHRVDVAEVVAQENRHVLRVLAELAGQTGCARGNGGDLLGLLLLQLDLERGHVTPHRSCRPHSAVRLSFDPRPATSPTRPTALPAAFETGRGR